MSDQPLDQRGGNRSQRPTSKAFRTFMAGQWAEPDALAPTRSPGAEFAAERRTRLAAQFPGERLVIPAGTPPRRSNDTDYRFRPHSTFAHLTGLGTDEEPDAVLVLHPLAPADDAVPSSPDTGASAASPTDDAVHTQPNIGLATGATPTTDHSVHTTTDAAAPADAGRSATHDPAATPPSPSHEAVLYIRPASGKDTSEFYADARYGEFWVGRRPTLAEIATATGIRTEHLDSLRDALAKDAGPGAVALRVIRSADQAATEMVDEIRAQAGLPASSAPGGSTLSDDDALDEATSELRLIKDVHEVAQLRLAVDATIRGFERVVQALPRAQGEDRGERVVEAAFEAGARIEGNGTGYDTIAAAGPHATTLHWTANTGRVRSGELLLLDAGVEVDSLYTADITRTIPVSGRYSPVQRRVWEAVVDAADAAFAAARPGNRFREVHEAAMVVIAERLAEWGLLPVGAAESLTPQGQQHRRWMVHGTSHHLGLDVHDCARARAELYLDGVLEPGMVFTIEPGIYFKLEDLAVPAEYRGIGARCEDDVLITADGNVNLSADLPRRADAIEEWMARIWAGS
ncbi:MAG: aminopeptidase P family protein [Bifidobacteriaceae bacterium]|nr:aminopeptidase P family protein [Bifidobacteriaceae bacterium]